MCSRPWSFVRSKLLHYVALFTLIAALISGPLAHAQTSEGTAEPPAPTSQPAITSPESNQPEPTSVPDAPLPIEQPAPGIAGPVEPGAGEIGGSQPAASTPQTIPPGTVPVDTPAADP